MSDLERRAVERDCLTSEQAAELLRSRLRSGELSHEALELCAFLRHEPALFALGTAAPAGKHLPHERWAGELSLPFWLAAVQVGIEVERRKTQATLGKLEANLQQDGPLDEELVAEGAQRREEGERFIAALGALEAWLLSPADSCPYSEWAELRESGWLYLRVHEVDNLFWLARDLLEWQKENGCSAEGVGHWRAASLLRYLLQIDYATRLLAEAGVPQLVGGDFIEAAIEVSEVAYLREQMRTVLSPERVRVAALSGHSPAVEVCGVASVRGVADWLAALHDTRWPFALAAAEGMWSGVHLPDELQRELGFEVVERLRPLFTGEGDMRIAELQYWATAEEKNEELLAESQEEVAQLAEVLRAEIAAARENGLGLLADFLTPLESVLRACLAGEAGVLLEGLLEVWSRLDKFWQAKAEKYSRGRVVDLALDDEVRLDC